jgi:hypothetical protein
MQSDPAKVTYYCAIVFGVLFLVASVLVYLTSGRLDVGGIAFLLIGFVLLVLPLAKDVDLDLLKAKAVIHFTTIIPASNLTPSIASSLRYKVSIVNESSTIADKDIESIVAALRKQITDHLSPAWGVSADLNFIPKGQKVPSGNWIISVLDQTDEPDYVSYRDLSRDGLPHAKIFAQTAKERGISWTLTISHELMEMLVNPRDKLSIFIDEERGDSTNKAAGKLYPIQVADPCSAENDGYSIDGVLVSDFVYPSWFDPNATKNARFDHQDNIKNPLQICEGGNVVVYEVKAGRWNRIVNDQSMKRPRRRR